MSPPRPARELSQMFRPRETRPVTVLGRQPTYLQPSHVASHHYSPINHNLIVFYNTSGLRPSNTVYTWPGHRREGSTRHSVAAAEGQPPADSTRDIKTKVCLDDNDGCGDGAYYSSLHVAGSWLAARPAGCVVGPLPHGSSTSGLPHIAFLTYTVVYN